MEFTATDVDPRMTQKVEDPTFIQGFPNEQQRFQQPVVGDGIVQGLDIQEKFYLLPNTPNTEIYSLAPMYEMQPGTLISVYDVPPEQYIVDFKKRTEGQ